MTQEKFTMPAEAISAIKRGEKIEAIKIIREATGIGLKEAKDIVDGYDGSALVSLHPKKDFAMPPEALFALQRGSKIDAIKSVREANKTGLKDAKDFIDDYLKNNPLLEQQYETILGEKNRTGIQWLVFIIAVGALVYLILSGKI